jgi:NAD(P)-dependent dehydrogenase (short-subunit alcohol dehydrogenase family)
VPEFASLEGKNALVTGGSRGIGRAIALELARAGASVVVCYRSGQDEAEAVAGEAGGRAVQADISNAEEAARLVGEVGDLDILVNNAGVMAIQELTLSDRGHEMQFATNHLGHFKLALGLRRALSEAGGARIVSVSSEAHLRAPLVFDDVNFASRRYDPWLAYGQSKTANVLFAVEAARRWRDDGITANALHPGAIAATNLARHLEPDVLARALDSGDYEVKTLEQGAATSVLVATSTQLAGIGGRYFADCMEAPVVGPNFRAAPRGVGVAAYALDPGNAAQLWDLSLQLIGQKP